MTTDPIPVHPVPARLLDASKNPVPHVNSLEQYKAMWKESVENPDQFFGKVKYIITVRGDNIHRFSLCVACS